jgi:hypothetical protein
MKQQADAVEVEETTSEPTPEEIMGRVRAMVGALLDASAAPPSVSYALAYVATELGLAVAGNSVQVFPVVLSAVSSAAADHKQEGDGLQACGSDASASDDVCPDGATLH